jgi:hypothetical protein
MGSASKQKNAKSGKFNEKVLSLIIDYEFEKDLGVSGVLFPDGFFQKCGNSQHHLLMDDIPIESQMACLYFSSYMRSDGDGLITHSPMKFNGVTPEQLDWMKKNFEYMDRGQKRRAAFDWLKTNVERTARVQTLLEKKIAKI